MSKSKIEALALEMLDESYKRAKTTIKKALDSGALDIDSWDESNAPMVTPKTILIAVLEHEARIYSPMGTSYERKVKKEVRNLSRFI